MKMRSDLKNPRKLKVKVSPYLFNSDNRNPTQKTQLLRLQNSKPRFGQNVLGLISSPCWGLLCCC